jgi:hypothetical protein
MFVFLSDLVKQILFTWQKNFSFCQELVHPGALKHAFNFNLEI